MKKLSLVLLLALSNVSFSQGIPTYDNASVMLQQQNFIKQLAEMAEQLKIAEAQLNSFKEEALQTQKRLEGYSNFGNIFDISDLEKSLDSLIKSIDSSKISSILQNIDVDMDIISNSESLKKNYEKEAEKYGQYENILEDFKNKNKKLDELRNQFNLAQTPQEREEISNNIALESMKMENEMKAIEYQLKMNELKRQIEQKNEVNKYFKSKTSDVWRGN